jgi:hypothetical protein
VGAKAGADFLFLGMDETLKLVKRNHIPVVLNFLRTSSSRQLIQLSLSWGAIYGKRYKNSETPCPLTHFGRS